MEFINSMQSQKKIGDFSLQDSIGKGRFATVYKAIHSKTKQPFAIKVIPKQLCNDNKLVLRQLKREADILKNQNHPNLMRLHTCFESERNFYLVLDLCEQGDLARFMTRNDVVHFSEKEALWIMRQILCGFRELRRKRVIHRDLKLENILIRGSSVILGDFGASKVVSHMTSTTVGTPLNMAPEVMSGGDYDSRSDLWSIGVVFYQLLMGKPPFFALSLGELNQVVRSQSGKNLKLGKQTHFCAEIGRLLKKLLEPDPRRRISWEELFSHQLFSDRHGNNCSKYSKSNGGARLKLFLDSENSRSGKIPNWLILSEQQANDHQNQSPKK